MCELVVSGPDWSLKLVGQVVVIVVVIVDWLSGHCLGLVVVKVIVVEWLLLRMLTSAIISCLDLQLSILISTSIPHIHILILFLFYQSRVNSLEGVCIGLLSVQHSVSEFNIVWIDVNIT